MFNGGVGSTALARHVLSLADKTHLEHAWSPLLYENFEGVRLGYMFGNPYNAVVSVFRRGFQHMHVQAMNSNSPTGAVNLRGLSLEEYLERGRDEFHIERQFMNWTNSANASHPTVLIKYERLGSHIGEVLEFFGCKKAFEVRTRTSSWLEQPQHIRRGLERIYGGLAERIETAPDLVFLPGTKHESVGAGPVMTRVFAREGNHD